METLVIPSMSAFALQILMGRLALLAICVRSLGPDATVEGIEVEGRLRIASDGALEVFADLGQPRSITILPGVIPMCFDALRLPGGVTVAEFGCGVVPIVRLMPDVQPAAIEHPAALAETLPAPAMPEGEPWAALLSAKAPWSVHDGPLPVAVQNDGGEHWDEPTETC